uniref:Uncharacterized protein n=1 Tax=Timema cristinae TaxID=61476 RepID=A0A7R9CCC3_TIMCR|nr:unnamed protein product [Timema cristinae]
MQSTRPATPSTRPATPSTRSVSPSTQPTPLSTRSAPSSKRSAPPSTRSTPPSTQSTPPSTQSTPQPTRSTPQPTRSTPQSTRSATPFILSVLHPVGSHRVTTRCFGKSSVESASIMQTSGLWDEPRLEASVCLSREENDTELAEHRSFSRSDLSLVRMTVLQNELDFVNFCLSLLFLAVRFFRRDEKVLTVLETFHRATLAISNEQTTISEVISIVNGIKLDMESNQDKSLVPIGKWKTNEEKPFQYNRPEIRPRSHQCHSSLLKEQHLRLFRLQSGSNSLPGTTPDHLKVNHPQRYRRGRCCSVRWLLSLPRKALRPANIDKASHNYPIQLGLNGIARADLHKFDSNCIRKLLIETEDLSEAEIDPIDSKREEFRKYLERAGVMEALTKVLVGLYEEAEKPTNALEYPL